MACEYLTKDSYDHLMRGEQIKFEDKHVMNMFDCGKYYFDGLFNVVEFPKGMSLYHGSSILTDYLIEIPLGPDFIYNQDKEYEKLENPKLINAVLDTDKDVLEGISDLGIRNVPGWFSFYHVANYYATRNNDCDKDSCVLAFRVTKDTKFILLQDYYNLHVLGTDPDFITDDEDRKEIVEAILEQFDVDVTKEMDEKYMMKYPMTRYFEELYRYSRYDGMYIIVNIMCKYIVRYDLEYAGYAMNEHTLVEKYDDDINYNFHYPEFLFCKPQKYLIRDYYNPGDWQFLDMFKIPLETRNVLEAMDVYKTTNINFHQGDLKHHSIWSALNVIPSLKIFLHELDEDTDNINDFLNSSEFVRITIISTLLHDIGKMFAENNTDNNRFIYYYAVPEHPEYGYEVIKGTKSLKLKIPTIPGMTKINEMEESYFDIKGIMRENNIDVNLLNLSLIMFSIHFHRDLGLVNYNSKSKIKKQILHYIQKYAKDIKFLTQNLEHQKNQEFSFKDMFLIALFTLIIVSMADINGASPISNNGSANWQYYENSGLSWFDDVMRKGVSRRYHGKRSISCKEYDRYYKLFNKFFNVAKSIDDNKYNNILSNI